MTDAQLSLDEAQAFLDANPVVQWIDAFMFDINGIPRGKRIRRSDLLGVVKSGITMPTSVFIMDPLGNCVEETGRLWETGDPDHHCHLLSRTLVPIPVGDGRHAQAVMVIDVKDELDPRWVLADQVERFRRAGQTPVAAVELEFYVTSRTTNGAFVLHTPEGLSADPGRPLTFGFEELDALAPFIDDVYRNLKLPVIVSGDFNANPDAPELNWFADQTRTAMVFNSPTGCCWNCGRPVRTAAPTTMPHPTPSPRSSAWSGIAISKYSNSATAATQRMKPAKR